MSQILVCEACRVEFPKPRNGRRPRWCRVCYQRQSYLRYRASDRGKAVRRGCQDRYYERHKAKILARDKARVMRLGLRFVTSGVTDAEFQAKLIAQGGVCAICGLTAAKWYQDHDHAFKIREREGHRGVLCNACNLMLGQAKDCVATLRAAADYLERWSRARDVAE